MTKRRYQFMAEKLWPSGMWLVSWRDHWGYLHSVRAETKRDAMRYARDTAYGKVMP